MCLTEREKTEQDGKRSTESRDENKIEFGEKCNFPMTLVLFLTNSKPSCTPGLEAGLVHSIEERKGKTKGDEELGRTESKKRKQHFRFLEGQRLNWPGTWVSPGVGEEPLQQRWVGAHRFYRRRAHPLTPSCPAQYLPLPLRPSHTVS